MFLGSVFKQVETRRHMQKSALIVSYQKCDRVWIAALRASDVCRIITRLDHDHVRVSPK